MLGNYKLILDKLINLKLTKDVVSVAVTVVGAAAAAVDVATAVANNGAFGVVVLLSLTKDEGMYVGASVAFHGACVSVFADGAGQLGEDDDIESAGGQVGHEDRGPRRFNRRGRGDLRPCRHRCHRRHQLNNYGCIYAPNYLTSFVIAS